MEIAHRIKEFVAGVIALIISILSPISVAISLIFMFSVADVFLGWKANAIVNGEEFKLNKAFNSFKKMTLFCSLTILIHLAFFLFKEVEMAEIVVKYMCWVLLVFYVQNMLNNAKKIFPKSKAIAFLSALFQLQITDILLARMGVNLANVKLKEEKKNNEGE